MANFVVIIDPDPSRRSQFIKTIEPLLPPVEGLITNSCATGDFQAIWAAAQIAPISKIADQEGAAVIWGEAINKTDSTRIDASTLRTIWKNSPAHEFPAYDGFYAAVAYHPDFGLIVGADLLGIFPIYYYISGEVALIASSPELFRHHPLFKTEFNPAGLVGILLTNCLFDGQTLWQNVRRLGAGHLLVWRPESSPREVTQYPIPGSSQSNQYSGLSFAEQVDILAQAFDQALGRHLPGDQRCSILLSGGLDSRMLAGFLHRRGVNPVAFTLGRWSDVEMAGAIPIVRTLGLEHHIGSLPFSEYPRYADTLIKWEHLANGCNRFMMWGVPSHLSKLAPRFTGGFLFDRVMGGLSTYYKSLEELSFESFFVRGVNTWGLSPALLEKLLRKEVFGDLVQDTLARIQTVYQSYSDEEYKRTWWFELHHRQRFHIGSAGWQFCFGAWPVIPILDRQLLEISAALPTDTLANRRAQKELVFTQFPELAKFALVDNSAHAAKPIQPNKISNLLFKVQRKVGRWQEKLGYERRHFCRIYDINRPGWQAVRQQAEPYREQVGQLFHEDVLNTVLPSPDMRVPCGSDPAESSGLKALLGFLLWSKNNLS